MCKNVKIEGVVKVADQNEGETLNILGEQEPVENKMEERIEPYPNQNNKKYELFPIFTKPSSGIKNPVGKIKNYKTNKINQKTVKSFKESITKYYSFKRTESNNPVVKPKSQKNSFNLKNDSPIAKIQDELVENSSVSESAGGGEKGERGEVRRGHLKGDQFDSRDKLETLDRGGISLKRATEKC